MSRIVERRLWPIGDWSDFKDWLVSSFSELDVGDIFELGPAGEFVYFDDAIGQVVPNIQIIGLNEGCRLLRLSVRPLSDPILPSFSVRGVEFWHRGMREPDPVGGYMVGADMELLAATCVQWFRDRWDLNFNGLGCELHSADQDVASDPPTRPPLHIA